MSRADRSVQSNSAPAAEGANRPRRRWQEALDRLAAMAERGAATRGDILFAAMSFGEAAAAENRSIEDAFAAMLGAGHPNAPLTDPALLGAVVRGYTDYMVKLRGLVRRGGTGPLSSHVARLAALHRINQAATTSLDLEPMLRTVVKVVKETMGADSCSIFLYEAASATLTLRATVGLNQEAIGRVRLSLGRGITGEAASTLRLLAVSDARSHPAYLDYPLVGDQAYTSQVSVPLALRSPDRLVGVLNILSIARREFDADELAFLETAAGEIAISIENARLYSETDAQLRLRISQLGTLQQMSRLVASTLDLSEVLRLIARQTVELVQATAAEIFRRPLPSAGGRLELLARYPSNEEAPQRAASLDDEIVELVEESMRTATAIWRRLGSDSLFVYTVPMLTARRAVGAICVYLHGRPSDPHEIQGLLNAFSDSAAIAVENAELYDEAVRGYTRASTLLQEMHHRVRNNLQTVAALLSMQARRAGDAEWTVPLQEAVSRIRSISVIHDILSGGNLRETTIETIAKHVVEEASVNTVRPDLRVNFVVEPSDVRVASRQATVLALLINEFVANAIVHGMRGREQGEIQVTAWDEGLEAVLEVRDDGCGVAPEFDPAESSGLGLQIARTLVGVDLRGSLEVAPNPHSERGTVVRVRFPLSESDEPAEG